MIPEKNVFPFLELETYESGTWTRWLGSARNVSINRGGKRNGVTSTVGVGSLTCTLVNAGDPLAGGALKPNLPIRIGKPPVGNATLPVAAVGKYSYGFETTPITTTAYTQNFEASIDSWTGGTNTTAARPNFLGPPYTRSGTWALTTTRTGTGVGQVQAKRTITGLTIGVVYTASAWVCSPDYAAGLNSAKVGVTGLSYGSAIAMPTTMAQVSYTFTATATSHELLLEYTSATSTLVFTTAYWDDVLVTYVANASAVVDSWTPDANMVTPAGVTAAFGRSGSTALNHNVSSVGTRTMTRVVTGLTIGLSYTFTAWLRSSLNGSNTFQIGVSGIGASAAAAVTTLNTYEQRTYSFVATATSHTLQLTSTTPSSSGGVGYWDDLSLSQDAYATPNPAYIPPVSLFTGRVVDVDVSVELDKTSGTTNTFVTLSAADSVSAHAAITRYGAVSAGATGFESWANRIIRLSSSATTSINPPADDSPIVRYGI